MVGTRDTPKDLQDSISFNDSPGMGNNFMSNLSLGGASGQILTPEKARVLGRDCYESSTNWLNAGRRAKWNDSLRAFQGLHPSGSKYLSGDYRYRSRLFRPKTRSMVRKGEASTAAAFFSNEDVVNISAEDDDDPKQQASASIMKRLIQYRLTKTIPWFLTVVGARQDCEVMGICIGKAFWKYEEQYKTTETRPQLHPLTGLPQLDENFNPIQEEVDIYEKIKDHPWIDLVAPENFRFDPGADWRNPIATSPYTIEMIPMYVCDVRAKIESGEWLPVADSSLLASSDLDDDVTRRSREYGRVPGKDHDAWKPRDFDICWVRENIIRWGSTDWHFFSLASAGELLTVPRPSKEVYLQGIRPYVCGFVLPEAHKTYPSSKTELIKDLQTQTNDVTNMRLDNVKLTLNPRQFVAQGKGIDPQDVRVFNPGKVVMTKDPRNDIVWDRPGDVTQSAYQEQDRINMDVDELVGGTSNSSMQANPQAYKAVGNMEIMDGHASEIEEYDQRVFAETFYEPMIAQLVRLEQAYETDPMILAIAGKEAQLFQKYGIDQITDDLLQQQLTVKVNVGIGATNPQTKLKNFSTATQVIGQIFGEAASMGANFEEVTKEVFSLCGYKDGARFFTPGFDVHQAQQQIAASKGGKHGAPAQGGAQQNDQGKIQVATINAQSKLQERQMQSQSDLQIAQLEYEKEQMHEQSETHRAVIDAHREIATMPQQQPMQHPMHNPMHPALAGAMGIRNV